MSLLKHASTQSKAHKTKTGSGKGQASYIRPSIYAEKSNVCNLLLKQDIRLVLKYCDGIEFQIFITRLNRKCLYEHDY